MPHTEPLRLRTLFGDYPQTLAQKTSAVRSASLAFDFADVKRGLGG